MLIGGITGALLIVEVFVVPSANRFVVEVAWSTLPKLEFLLYLVLLFFVREGAGIFELTLLGNSLPVLTRKS